MSTQSVPLHLVYDDTSARDFGALPARCGWQGGDDYSISFRTDLSNRDDLVPDPAAVRLELDALFSAAFRTFYETVWQAKKHPSDARTLLETLPTLHAFAEQGGGELHALRDGDTAIGMGIVTTLTAAGERAAGINMLGVSLGARGRGWGKRLHRHLMWVAQGRAPLYLGHTDSSNTPMLRLFEVNGCTPSGKQWELEPV